MFLRLKSVNTAINSYSQSSRDLLSPYSTRNSHRQLAESSSKPSKNHTWTISSSLAFRKAVMVSSCSAIRSNAADSAISARKTQNASVAAYVSCRLIGWRSPYTQIYALYFVRYPSWSNL